MIPLLGNPASIVSLPTSLPFGTYPSPLGLGSFSTARFSILTEFHRAFMVEEIHVDFSIFLLKLLMRHQIFLLTIVVPLLRASSGHIHRVLMLECPRVLAPVVIESALCDHSIVTKGLYPPRLYVTQDRLLDIGVIKKLLLEFGFILRWKQWPRIGSPFVGLSHDKASNHFPIVFLLKIFGVFDIFHI